MLIAYSTQICNFKLMIKDIVFDFMFMKILNDIIVVKMLITENSIIKMKMSKIIKAL